MQAMQELLTAAGGGRIALGFPLLQGVPPSSPTDAVAMEAVSVGAAAETAEAAAAEAAAVEEAAAGAVAEAAAGSGGDAAGEGCAGEGDPVSQDSEQTLLMTAPPNTRPRLLGAFSELSLRAFLQAPPNARPGERLLVAYKDGGARCGVHNSTPVLGASRDVRELVARTRTPAVSSPSFGGNHSMPCPPRPQLLRPTPPRPRAPRTEGRTR